MANQNIQASVVLGGPGHVARPRGDYRKGEYRRLVNAEVVDDRIVSRRNVNGPNYVHGDGVSGVAQRDINFGPLGFWNHWTVFAGYGWQAAYDSSGNVFDMFSPDNLSLPELESPPTLPNYDSLLQLIGFFQYNQRNYWLSMVYVSEDSYFGYSLCSSPDTQKSNLPPNVDPEYLLDADKVIRIDYTDPDFTLAAFKNFMLFKERLWIVTEGTIYFSAATDPSDFSVDSGGGFFRFPGEQINYAMAIGDYIYVLCKGSVYTITYSDDPNEDAITRIISDNIGGLYGCIFKSEPYFLNNEGLFLINNNYIEKVFNTDFDEGLNLYPRQTLTPFNNYLVINKNYQANVYGYKAPEDPTSDYGVRVNLIPNPSLETDATGYIANTNTTIAHHTGAANTPFGTDCLKVTVPVASAVSVTRGFHTTVTPDSRIPVEPNTTYTVSFYISRPTTVDVKTEVGVDILGYKNAGVDTANIEQEFFTLPDPPAPTGVPTGTWTRYAFTFHSLDSEEIELWPYVRGTWVAGEEYFVDGLLLEEGDETKSYFDGTFASDILGWQYITKSDRVVALNPSFKYNFGLIPYQYAVGDDPNGNDSGYNTYFINMENGSTHVLDYRPMYDDGDDSYAGYINYIAVNPNVNDENPAGTALFLGTSDILDDEVTTSLGNQHVWYMNYETSEDIRDHVVRYTAPSTASRVMDDPKVLIELTGFTPDGNEYLIKKFRSLELMGKFPQERFETQVSYDNTSYGTARDLNDDESLLLSGEMRLHLPHRLGLNQRGRSFNLKFQTNSTEPLNELYDFLEISNIRILWAYTQRSNKYASFNPAT